MGEHIVTRFFQIECLLDAMQVLPREPQDRAGQSLSLTRSCCHYMNMRGMVRINIIDDYHVLLYYR